jgi:hypothetical protein
LKQSETKKRIPAFPRNSEKPYEQRKPKKMEGKKKIKPKMENKKLPEREIERGKGNQNETL